MEPSSHRTCTTSSTWHHQATEASPSPSVTCCSRYWRRRQKRDGRRWFECHYSAAHLSRDMSHLLLWVDEGDMSLVSEEEGLTHKGRGPPPLSPPMWVGPRGVWDHISWVECWVWRGAEEGERCHYRRRHCDCTRNLYCKRICQGETTLNYRHTEVIQLHLSLWITSVAL